MIDYIDELGQYKIVLESPKGTVVETYKLNARLFPDFLLVAAKTHLVATKLLSCAHCNEQFVSREKIVEHMKEFHLILHS